MGDTQDLFEEEATIQLWVGATPGYPFGTWLEDDDTFARLEVLDAWTGNVVADVPALGVGSWTFGEDDTDFYAQLNFGTAGLTGTWSTWLDNRSDVAVMYKIYVLQGHFEGGNGDPQWVTDNEILTFAGDLKPPSTTWGPRLMVPRDRFIELRIPKAGGAQRPLAEWILRMGVGAAYGVAAKWRTWLCGGLTLELFRGDPLHGGTRPTGGSYAGHQFGPLSIARRSDGMWLLPLEVQFATPTADWGSISHIAVYDRPAGLPNATLLWVAPLDRVIHAVTGIKVIIPPGRFTWQVA